MAANEQTPKQEPAGAPPALSAILPRWLPWAIATSLALACVILWAQGGFLQQQANTLKAQLDNVGRRAERLRSQSADLKAQLVALEVGMGSQRDRSYSVSTRLVWLHPQNDPASRASGVVVCDGERQQGEVMVRGLAPLEPESFYMLWVMDDPDHAPVAAALLHVEVEGQGRVEFRLRSRVSRSARFSVSREIARSPTRPTEPVILSGP